MLLRLSIANGLQAHFKQPDGSSRPGTDWIVVLKGDREDRVLVRTYADRTPRKTDQQHASAAIAYVSHLLETGWSPTGDEPSEITVPDDFAPSAAAPAAKKPWWRFW